MKYFEASGLWYPSDDRSSAVGGTLKFDSDGLQLVLLGSFRQGWSPEGERYSIIHGVVGESPYGFFVTLIDCHRLQSTFNMIGVTSEKITCIKGAVGNCHLSDGDSRFKSLELDLSYLTEWVEFGGFGSKLGWADDKSYTTTYRKPENARFPFGEKTLTLGFSFRASQGAHRTTLSEKARLIIEPTGDISPATIGLDHVKTLMDLLSFATDRPNAAEDIAYWAETNESGLTPKLNLIYDPVFRPESKKDSLHSMDMVFSYRDTQALGLNIFQQWLAFAEKHPAFNAVYFDSIYASPRYLHDKFAKLLSAFTLLCSNLGKTSEKTRLFLVDAEASLKAHFLDEERGLLGHLIPTEADVEMPMQLLGLLRENADLMGQVIDDFPSFVSSVSDTLAFIVRRVEGERHPIQGADLYLAMEKIRMLIKIVILRELGFNDESIKILIERNVRFNRLKAG